MIDIHMFQLRVERAETAEEILEAYVIEAGKHGWGNNASKRFWDKIRPYMRKDDERIL